MKISYSISIYQKIGNFQVPMDYIIVMQLVHSLGNINGYSD